MLLYETDATFWLYLSGFLGLLVLFLLEKLLPESDEKPPESSFDI